MSKLSLLAGRIALAACITLLPLAVGAQTDSMSKSACGSQGQMSKVSLYVGHGEGSHSGRRGLSAWKQFRHGSRCERVRSEDAAYSRGTI